MFPDDIVKNTSILYLQFPDKERFILSHILWLLIGSLLFTIIILIIFYISIRTIVKQKKLSEIKADFVNNMTHEFKTPIATISVSSEMLTQDLINKSPERVKKYAKIIFTLRDFFLNKLFSLR